MLIADTSGLGSEVAAAAEAAGFGFTLASTAREALRAIADNPRIGVVVASIDEGPGNGLAVLEPIAARYMPVRPVVPLVLVRRITAASALLAMRVQAADLVEWPDLALDLGDGLARAHARWQQLNRMARGEWGLGAVDALLLPRRDRGEGERMDDAALLRVIRSIMATRREREAEFGASLFADPAWDILLDLTAARISGHPVPVLGACAAACVPTSTALRWVGKLIEAGLVRRWKDPQDRRRDLVELEDHGLERMRALIGQSRIRAIDRP